MSNRPFQNPDEDLPEWLKELRKRQKQASQSDKDSEEKRGDAEAPRSTARSLSDTQPLPAGGGLTKRRVGEEPDLTELGEQPESIEEKQRSKTPPFEEEVREEISPGEMPAWLRALRPSEVGPKRGDIKSSASDQEETIGPLAGISGVLPAEPSVLSIGKTPSMTAILDVTKAQQGHAATFERLIAAEALPSAEAEKKVVYLPRVLNLVASAVIILAILFPLITRSEITARPELDAFPEAASVFTLIEELPAEALVLVAIEVEPALFGESEPAITSVLAHLLERQARLVFFSTRPTGPALAVRLVGENFAEGQFVEGEDYISLGYLSGGMAALRNFASDPRAGTISSVAALNNPWESPILEPVENISDFSLVIVAGSNAEDVRGWIEQTNGYLDDGLLAVTSAQATPLLKPFLTSHPNTLNGLISGISGSAYYERLRGQEGLGRRYWDATSYGIGAVTLVILFGGLASRFLGIHGTGKPIH
jgi:hypothetical protein